MEVAPRLHPRDRISPYQTPDRHSQTDDSGADSEPISTPPGHAHRMFLAARHAAVADTAATPAESRARRKFQRATNTAGDNDSFSFRKPSLPASATRPAVDAKQPSMSHRRKSTLKDSRGGGLLGPRPLDSPSKRIVSDSGGAAAYAAHRAGSFLPTSASEPSFDKTIKTKDSRFSFGEAVVAKENAASNSTGSSFSFLPPVSFDDFQSSIASYEPMPSPRLSDFPVPAFSNKPGSRTNTVPKHDGLGRKPSNAADPSSSATQIPATKATKAQSFVRRYSNAQRDTSLPNLQAVSAIPQVQAPPLSLRTRRQSQAAPVTTTPVSSAAARPPRKSVGPGMLTNMIRDRRTLQDSATAATNSASQSTVSRTPSLSKAGTRPTALPTHALPTRASKAKSMQPLPRSATLPDLAMPEGKPRTQRSDTPSSIDKRKSGRMSGLGARTISPTDARRLRRLSMKQNPPPPSTPGDLPREGRLATKSPSMIPRMPSVTPSSQRETPDSVAKMQFPGLSLSRSSSYQSLRAPSATGSNRIGQSASMSKLPTPKSRNVYSSNEKRDDEVVPPVPAIPKAYESPKEQIEIPFFANLKTSALSRTESDSALPPPSSRPADNPSTPSSERSRHRRGLTMNSAMATENPTALPPINKKSLQPLRLPPLNLLPLGSPMKTRISSFPAPSCEVDDRGMTPPPKRGYSKTPSTPMTASKATFYRRQDDELPMPVGIRSASSHYALRGVAQFDESDNGVPLPSPLPTKRQAITPFTSGSLPKPAANFNPKARLPDEYTLGNHHVETPAAKPMGPRPRTASKSVKDSPSAQTASSGEEPEAPSSGNSLRRKLSLGWRRAASKNANHALAEQSQSQTQTKKHDDMPPPRLPASATWNGASQNTSSLAQPNNAMAPADNTRRKPSVALNVGNANGYDPLGKPNISSNPALRQMHSTPGQPVLVQRSSSWSILGTRQATRTAPPPTLAKNKPPSTPQMDKEETSANEEMKKLSSKRRDVDTAARETDELRKQATPKDRKSPAQAIQASAGLLNIFEKGEIVDFKDGVYFCGTPTAKKHVGDISASSTTNFGYDDERGDYNIVMGDHLAYRYEVVDVLGKGSFGQVVRCIDHKNGGLCAVKIIRNKKRFHQQALVEVNILQKLKEWDPDEAHATLTITSSFYFRSHLCITSPCLSINLYELIRAHNFTGFSLQLIRRFSRQLLACLCLLQTKRIIHCDLKPENILLCDPRRADVRVIDFGSSCKADEKVYTYIQSRFYRSPEVILGSEYGLGIDMWSLGCILAELYTGYPIFPGENEQEQLACIMEIFGPPNRDIIEKCSRRKLFFDSSLKPRVTVSSKGRRRRPSSKTLSGALKCDDEAFLDFLAQCLRWDPDRRMRPDQAFSHPFLTNEPMRRAQVERPRVRTAVASSGATATGVGSSSPVKRMPAVAATGGISAGAATATPARERARPLPETPSTSMRNGVPVPVGASSSPIKVAARRQSTAPGAVAGSNGSREERMASQNQIHAMAGSKRASNGALLMQQHERQFQQQSVSYGGGAGNSGLPRVVSGKADMAGAAARESMGAAGSRRRG
ncbi:hypothetical protein MBLNU459_g2793t1 [Dothideomycetes sp. NU459]